MRNGFRSRLFHIPHFSIAVINLNHAISAQTFAARESALILTSFPPLLNPDQITVTFQDVDSNENYGLERDTRYSSRILTRL
jgi:hypothetical protein